MATSDITRVAAKVKAFREDYPPEKAAILTSFTEDEVGGVPRVVGACRVILVESGALIAEAYGTRALRAPKPGAQGHMDTRDPDRAMTQATGRAMGLLGYADGESIEGDTDEPDESGVQQAAEAPKTAGKRGGARSNGAESTPPAPVTIRLATMDQVNTIRALTKKLSEDDRAQVVAGKTLRTATVFEQRLLDDDGRIAITAKAAEGLIGTLEGLVEDAESVPDPDKAYDAEDPGRPFNEPESRPVVDAVSQTGFL